MNTINPQLSDKFEIVMSMYYIDMSISKLDIDSINNLCECINSIEYNLHNNIVICEFVHILKNDIETCIEYISKYGVEQLIIKPKSRNDDTDDSLFIACMFGNCIYHKCIYDIASAKIVKHKFKFKFFTINHVNKNITFNNNSIIGRLLTDLKDLYILQNY